MDFLLGAGAVKASSALTGRQLEHGVGLQENQTNLKKEKCVEMWKNGKYNNIECKAARYDDNPGYICEKQVSKFMITPNLC